MNKDKVYRKDKAKTNFIYNKRLKSYISIIYITTKKLLIFRI